MTSTCRPRCATLLESGAPKASSPATRGSPAARRSSSATPLASLEAAAKVAREAGYAAHILGDAIEGEAREVGKVLAASRGMSR